MLINFNKGETVSPKNFNGPNELRWILCKFEIVSVTNDAM